MNPGNSTTSSSFSSGAGRGVSRKRVTVPSQPSCDLDNCDNSGDYSGSMPTLQNFSGNDYKHLTINYQFSSLEAGERTVSQQATKDIMEDSDDSDCMILDTVSDDSKYKHKQNLISGIYGKVHDKVSPKKKHLSGTDFPDLSDGSLSGSDDSDSLSESSVSSCPSEILPSVLSGDDSCDSSNSGDNTLPPLLEPQIPELSKRKSKENLAKNVGLKPKLKERPKNLKNKKKVECGSQTEETAFSRLALPSSPSPSSSSSSCNLVQSNQSHHTFNPSPPLLSGFGAQSSKLNRGRPRKNPPTLQPQIATKKDGSTSTCFPADDSTDSTADETEENKKKTNKDKLSVLFGAAKHWQRKQDTFKDRDDCYEFTDEVSDKEENSSRSSDFEEKDVAKEFCDKKHSKAINLKHSNKKSKHKKRFPATPEKLKKYKRFQFLTSEKTKTKVDFTTDEEKTEPCVQKKKKGKRNVLTGDMDYFKFRDQKMQKSSEHRKAQVESDASSCFEDFLNSSNVKRELKPEVDVEQRSGPVYQQFSTKVSNSFGKSGGLIFSKKYCTLKPEAFWKMSKRKLSSDEFRDAKLEVHSSELKQEPATSASSSVFATKASLKEMPNVPRNQVQQMISVLASAGRFQHKVSKKKKEKDDRKSYRDSRTRTNYETAYETQSEDEEGSIKRKNKKIWKSKHKNVVDPVFLGELEHLIRDIASCQLETKLSTDFWPARPSDSVPSIFKRRKIFTTRRRRDLNKITKRGKNSRHADSAIEILDLTSENDEQRLPLKKRHHHLQGDGEKLELNTSFEDVDIEPLNPTQALIQIKTPEKICREYGGDPGSKENDGSDSSYSLSYDGRSMTGLKVLQDKLIKKPTAADRIVEKLGLGLGIQIKKENSNCGGRNDSNMEKNGRGGRRISKDLEIVGGNSSKDFKINIKACKDQKKVPSIQIKPESKLKDGEGEERSFVANMKDCIDKYTTSSLAGKSVESFKGHSSKYQRSRKNGSKNSPIESSSSKRSSACIPILSSPEPEITICSGRESSLSQSSNSSDSGSVINIDAPDQAEPACSSQQKTASRLGRSSRQDLHSHLWRHEKSRCEPKSGYEGGASRHVNTETEPGANISSYQSQSHPQPQPSKPLPTEPIRRVDLGPLGGYCNKPGFGSQEMVMKKVPQAIVAPFRRHPPEAAPAVSQAQVVPIHRASFSIPDIGARSSLATVPTPSTSTSSSSPSTTSGVKQSGPSAQEISSNLSGEEQERKHGEIESNKEEEEEKVTAGPAKMKKCAVAVERLRRDVVSTDTLAGRKGSHGKESSGLRLENSEKSDSTLNIVSRDKTTKENKCSTRNLESAISGKKGDFGGNNSGGVSGDREKEEDNCSVNTKINLNDSLRDQHNESKVRTKKRRRKTNKTGFPCKIKKKKKISQPADCQDTNTKLAAVEKILDRREKQTNLLPSPTPRLVKTSKGRGGIFDNLDTFKISAANIELEPKKQTFTGRPLRECRSQEPEPEVSSSDPPVLKLKKRSSTPDRPRGRPPKRPKVSQTEISPSKGRSSSSVDPSPASSDVESMDCRSFLDEEMDADYLTILPSSEDNLLSPSRAESSEVQTEEKKKKPKPSNIIKKNFLQAGLFSYDYKSESVGKVGQENLIKSKGLMYRPEEHPFSLLPPPYYCGRQLRQKKEDFALPFDLWQLHSTQSLPNRDIIATWNYKRIKANVFLDVKPTPKFETPACHCRPPSNCGDKCLNRMTYTECDPETCPLGDSCSNLVIQKHLSSVVVQRFMTNEKGFGIRTKTHINPGSFIMEYLGEVVTDKEFKRRMNSDYQKDSHHYCLHVGEGVVIDGHRMGGECRFVNHSCSPNCEMQKWSVNGMWRMALFSKVAIPVNQELTYDYNFSLFNPHEGQTCHCGAQECRGVIGGKGKKVAGQKSSKPGKQSKDSKSSKSESMQKESKMHKEPDASCETKYRSSGEFLNKSNLNHFAPLKPMTAVQQQFCRRHSVLLLRNLEKIRKLRDLYLNRGKFPAVSTQQKSDRKVVEHQKNNSFNTAEVFKAGLTALTTARSVQTRRLALAQDNPDVSKVVQIAKTFQEIIDALKTLKTEDGKIIMSEFLNLPSKEDLPQYYCKISEPIDFSSITASLSSGSYHSVAQVDQDILLLLQNMTRFYGSSSRLGEYANQIRAKYLDLSTQSRDSLSELVGAEGVQCLVRPDPPITEEDIINCPCDQFKDEGVMVQCDTCSCWQHTDCIGLDTEPDKVEHFVCYKCSGEKISLDIPLVPQPEFASAGETYYVSLAREDGLKLTLGITVYVLRAFKQSDRARGEESEKVILGHGGVPHKSISPIKGPSKEAETILSGSYPTYKTVSSSASTQDMDIFRVERLWINEAGKKFAFGYHYLRPHETFHEPSRKFFDNEVFRVPIYEVLPIDSIYGRCWVMDPVTFCRFAYENISLEASQFVFLFTEADPSRARRNMFTFASTEWTRPPGSSTKYLNINIPPAPSSTPSKNLISD